MIYSSKSNVSNDTEIEFLRHLYLTATWNYGLEENFPETISVNRWSGKWDVYKKKIYRFSDFVKEMKVTEELWRKFWAMTQKTLQKNNFS